MPNSLPSKRALRGCALSLFCLLLAAPAALAQAPAAPAASSAQPGQPAQPEGPVIRKIEVKFSGIASITEEIVRANMSLREGVPYDVTLVDRDIRSLYRTMLFERIEVQRVPVDAKTLDLIFTVWPKMRIGGIRFEGNKQVSSKRLEDETLSRSSGVLDERLVKDDADKILEHYRKSGYSQARVDYTIDRDPVSGFGTIVFKIDEGNKVKIAAVEFVGNEKIKSSALRKKMETRKHWMFSWLTGSGKFKDQKFEEDIETLRDFYRDEGFLDIEIDPAKVTFSYPSEKKMTITIPVQEGKQYKIGEIKVSGSKLFPSELLRRVARVDTGMIFSPTKLDEETKRLEDFYGQFGYLETSVRLVRRPNVTTGAIDLEFSITESERYTVESVNIEGNTKTKSIVVLREVLLAPGDVFDSVRMETTKARLENTRFFEDINVTPESTNIPNRKNLKITFKEGRTGNLTFGAGFSSLEKAVFFIELTQSNFDLFNRRSFFQGDGQKFRLKAQIGSYSSDVILAFEEPWLFERQLALGFEVYRMTSNYDSAYYDETRYGFEVYLRKRLIELIEGRLSYRFETIEISNYSGGGGAIGGLLGKESISKVGFSLLRDTRNNLITTTRGSRLEGLTEVAGGPFGADVSYYRLEGRAAQYVPVFGFQNQTLEIVANLGTIQEYGDSTDVPFYDRYFLGGPNNMRGFEYRDVGPKNFYGEPVGGKSMGFLSLEYSIDIVHPVRWVFFYDAGFINRGSFDFNTSNMNDNWGFGLRFFLMGSPLRLDYAFPLTTDGRNDEGNQFNFSFGTKF
ncbi:MAG: outer membrane protein assembly factor BamA [Opitutaceae bacterium]|nr:outer membrane protein assembly factor BamA [Opitutaceae bacterium]